jgi:hypothetical protein
MYSFSTGTKDLMILAVSHQLEQGGHSPLRHEMKQHSVISNHHQQCIGNLRELRLGLGLRIL